MAVAGQAELKWDLRPESQDFFDVATDVFETVATAFILPGMVALEQCVLQRAACARGPRPPSSQGIGTRAQSQGPRPEHKDAKGSEPVAALTS